MEKITPKSIGRSNYLLTFVDDYSRKVFVYFIKTKNEVYYSKFIEFKVFIEKQTGKSIKNLRSDNGGEYVNQAFEKACVKYPKPHKFTQITLNIHILNLVEICWLM